MCDLFCIEGESDFKKLIVKVAVIDDQSYF